MKKILLVLIVFVYCRVSSYAQSNLVPNPGFEIYTACPSGAGQLGLAPPWYSPTLGTADYFNICAPTSSGVSVPYCDMIAGGFQYAHTGAGFAGIEVQVDSTFTISPPIGKYYREYIQAPLVDSLNKEKMYCVTFYVNLLDGSSISIDNMGALFTSTPDTEYQNLLPLTTPPQIINIPGEYLSDTLNWMKIEGHFIANGGEKYITIGNFKYYNEDQKPTGDNSGYPGAYYNIDDVSVREMPQAITGSSTSIQIGGSAIIGTTPGLPGVTYHWFPAAGLSDTNSSQTTAKPSQTTTYTLVVSSDSCTCTDTATVTVTIEQPNNIFIPDAFSPNGDGQNDVLLAKGINVNTFYMAIYDRWGNKVFETTNLYLGWDGTYKEKPEETGAYTYYANGSYTDGTAFNKKGNITLVR